MRRSPASAGKAFRRIEVIMENLDRTCRQCGSPSLSDGDMVGLGFGFQPDDCNFWVVGTSQISVRALMCRQCGELMLKGDLSKLRRLDPKASE